MAHSCCFGLRGNLDFLQKKSFITSTTGNDPINNFLRKVTLTFKHSDWLLRIFHQSECLKIGALISLKDRVQFTRKMVYSNNKIWSCISSLIRKGCTYGCIVMNANVSHILV